MNEQLLRSQAKGYAPVNEPGTGVIRLEANGGLVSGVAADADYITLDGIIPVVSSAISTAHNEERVLLISSRLDVDPTYGVQNATYAVQMNRVLDD